MESFLQQHTAALVGAYLQSLLQTMMISSTSGMFANVRRLWHAMGMPHSSRYCLGMLACAGRRKLSRHKRMAAGRVAGA